MAVVTPSSSVQTPPTKLLLVSVEGNLFGWFLRKPSATMSLCMSLQIPVTKGRWLTTHRVIYSFDVRHMPQGCATWPAIWETGLDDWPNQGELDILEGVNDVSPNAISIHTSLGCTVSNPRDQTGTTQGTDCGTHSDNDPGCAVMDSNQNSYGPAFNKNGGGWYAIERSGSFINSWFWPRNASPPDEVRNGNDQINTDSWVS